MKSDESDEFEKAATPGLLDRYAPANREPLTLEDMQQAIEDAAMESCGSDAQS